MSQLSRRVWAYARARLLEPSTWRGLTLLVTVLGWQVSPEQAEVILFVGLTVSGLIGVIFPEKK